MTVKFIQWGLTALTAAALAGCGGDADNVSTGVFVDGPVSGLNYVSSANGNGITDASGAFTYATGDTVTFRIGNLTLGSATGAATLTPLTITSGATAATDPKVNNKLILLQSVDADGDLNNGIQISEAIRTIVSANAASINFDQAPTAFAASLAPLMTALNTAKVFTGTDPRARTLRTAASAVEHFARVNSERKTVTTQSGQVRGFSATATAWQFLGIPYAKPPLGDLRWKAPQAPTPWSGVRDAVAWADQAAQNPAYQSFGEGGMSEDSLYLNVTAPKNAENLPVMVYFHGGGFSTLTGNTKAFNNAASLTTKGVVLVVVNHRLNTFGYLAHPLLTAESGYNGSGNYGQMDQVMALNWVKSNIAAFGGNPANVTLFGESGGGGKVLYSLISPKATGLFHKAVVQSGIYPRNTPRALAPAEANGTALFAALGVTTLAEARAKPWTEVELAGRTLVSAEPNVDGYNYTGDMVAVYTAGTHNDVPLISGMNMKDIDNPGLGLGITGLINEMPWLASRRTSPTFVYNFSRVPAGWAAQNVGAYHGIELAYLFNYTGSLYSHYLLGLTGLTVDRTKSPATVIAESGFGVADVAVADNMMTMWSNFAKTGNPSTATFRWPVYTATGDAYAEIGAVPVAKTGLATAFQP